MVIIIIVVVNVVVVVYAKPEANFSFFQKFLDRARAYKKHRQGEMGSTDDPVRNRHNNTFDDDPVSRRARSEQKTWSERERERETPFDMRYRGAGSKQGVYGWATTTTDADHSGSKPVLLLLGDSRTRNDVQRYIHRVTSGSTSP